MEVDVTPLLHNILQNIFEGNIDEDVYSAIDEEVPTNLITLVKDLTLQIVDVSEDNLLNINQLCVAFEYLVRVSKCINKPTTTREMELPQGEDTKGSPLLSSIYPVVMAILESKIHHTRLYIVLQELLVFLIIGDKMFAMWMVEHYVTYCHPISKSVLCKVANKYPKMFGQMIESYYDTLRHVTTNLLTNNVELLTKGMVNNTPHQSLRIPLIELLIEVVGTCPDHSLRVLLTETNVVDVINNLVMRLNSSSSSLLDNNPLKPSKTIHVPFKKKIILNTTIDNGGEKAGRVEEEKLSIHESILIARFLALLLPSIASYIPYKLPLLFHTAFILFDIYSTTRLNGGEIEKEKEKDIDKKMERGKKNNAVETLLHHLFVLFPWQASETARQYINSRDKETSYSVEDVYSLPTEHPSYVIHLSPKHRLLHWCSGIQVSVENLVKAGMGNQQHVSTGMDDQQHLKEEERKEDVENKEYKKEEQRGRKTVKRVNVKELGKEKSEREEGENMNVQTWHDATFLSMGGGLKHQLHINHHYNRYKGIPVHTIVGFLPVHTYTKREKENEGKLLREGENKRGENGKKEKYISIVGEEKIPSPINKEPVVPRIEGVGSKDINNETLLRAEVLHERYLRREAVRHAGVLSRSLHLHTLQNRPSSSSSTILKERIRSQALEMDALRKEVRRAQTALHQMRNKDRMWEDRVHSHVQVLEKENALLTAQHSTSTHHLALLNEELSQMKEHSDTRAVHVSHLESVIPELKEALTPQRDFYSQVMALNEDLLVWKQLHHCSFLNTNSKGAINELKAQLQEQNRQITTLKSLLDVANERESLLKASLHSQEVELELLRGGGSTQGPTPTTLDMNPKAMLEYHQRVSHQKISAVEEKYNCLCALTKGLQEHILQMQVHQELTMKNHTALSSKSSTFFLDKAKLVVRKTGSSKPE